MIMVFFRGGTFYSVWVHVPGGKTAEEVAKEHAECNPGTILVEDGDRGVLWKAARH